MLKKCFRKRNFYFNLAFFGFSNCLLVLCSCLNVARVTYHQQLCLEYDQALKQQIRKCMEVNLNRSLCEEYQSKLEFVKGKFIKANLRGSKGNTVEDVHAKYRICNYKWWELVENLPKLFVEFFNKFDILQLEFQFTVICYLFICAFSFSLKFRHGWIVICSAANGITAYMFGMIQAASQAINPKLIQAN